MRPYYLLFNLGAGVESVALLVKWILDPSSRPLDPNTGQPVSLGQIIVLFAMTGLEYRSTKALCETYLLPLLRQNRIRLIQVGRAGPSFNDGLVIAQDSTSPVEFFCTREDADRLGIWKLSDEHDISATTPKLGRPHTCAMKYKGFPLDSVIALLEHNARAGDVGRPLDTKDIDIARKAKDQPPVLWGPVLGYNLDEAHRKEQSSEYGCRGESYLYPLIDDLKWDRMACFNYLLEVFGVAWKKSACTRCPFVEEWSAIERYQVEPYGAVDAVQAEFNVLALNDRMHLFSHSSAYSFSTNHVPEVREMVEDSLRRLDDWAVFRVRRCYEEIYAPTKDKQGQVKDPVAYRVDSQRELVKVARGSRAEMGLYLVSLAETMDLPLEKVTAVDLRKRKFRSNRQLVAGLSTSQIVDLSYNGRDFRGEAYLGWSQPKKKLDDFDCFPFVRAVRHSRPILSFPAVEEFYVVAPDRINEKVASQRRFDETWYRLTGEASQGQQLQLFI
jgi:hypothetical protein